MNLTMLELGKPRREGNAGGRVDMTRGNSAVDSQLGASVGEEVQPAEIQPKECTRSAEGHVPMRSETEYRSDVTEAGGSNPSLATVHFPKFTWRQRLGPEGCPYVVRWVADFGAFSFRLHHWLKSDDCRHPHDHAWDFASLVLWGRVGDREPPWLDLWRGPLSVTLFPAEHRHAVIIKEPAWTMLLCGPPRRRWGFWVERQGEPRFMRKRSYFFRFGHHDPCAPP